MWVSICVCGGVGGRGNDTQLGAAWAGPGCSVVAAEGVVVAVGVGVGVVVMAMGAVVVVVVVVVSELRSASCSGSGSGLVLVLGIGTLVLAGTGTGTACAKTGELGISQTKGMGSHSATNLAGDAGLVGPTPMGELLRVASAELGELVSSEGRGE